MTPWVSVQGLAHNPQSVIHVVVWTRLFKASRTAPHIGNPYQERESEVYLRIVKTYRPFPLALLCDGGGELATS